MQQTVLNAKDLKKSFESLKPYLTKNHEDDFSEKAHIPADSLSGEAKSSFDILEKAFSHIGGNPIKTKAIHYGDNYGLINEYTYIEGAHNNLAEKAKRKIRDILKFSRNPITNVCDLGMYFEAFNTEHFRVLEKMHYLLPAVLKRYADGSHHLSTLRKAKHEKKFGKIKIAVDAEGNPLIKTQAKLKKYYDKCDDFVLTLSRRAIWSAAMNKGDDNFYTNRNFIDAEAGVTPLQYYYRRGIVAYIHSIDPKAVTIAQDGSLVVESFDKLFEREEFALLKEAYESYKKCLAEIVDVASSFAIPTNELLPLTTVSLQILSPMLPEEVKDKKLFRTTEGKEFTNYTVREYDGELVRGETYYNYTLPIKRTEAYLKKYCLTLDEIKSLQ